MPRASPDGGPPRECLNAPARGSRLGLFLRSAILTLAGAAIVSNARGSAAEDYLIRSWQVKDGLPHQNVLAITQGAEGYLWVATAGGLARFDGERFKAVRPEVLDGLNFGAVRALQCDAEGALWMVTASGLLALGKEGSFARLPENQGHPPSGAHGVYSDARGRIIVSSADGQVFQAVGERLQPWLDARTGARGTFIGINVESTGAVWVRHGHALSWWDGGQWQALRSPDGSEPFDALKTGASLGGGMWVSSRTGLRRFNNGSWEARELAYAQPVGGVQAVCEDSRGNVWVTFGFGGLTRFDSEGKRGVIGAREGLCHDAVRQIFEDAEGNLWLGTEGGLNSLSPRHPGRHASARQPWPVPRVLAEALRADARLAWERPAPGALAAPLIALPAATRIVEAHYSVLNFTGAGWVRSECRLQGWDSDWMDSSARRKASYTNLPPGLYELQARVANASGVWSEARAVLRFEIEPRFWQRWAFWPMIGSMFAATAFVWHRAGVGRLQRQRTIEQSFSFRLIESQEAERQRIAAELHDSVGQKLLVIKNSAQLGLRDLNSKEEVAEQLDTVSRTASECLDEIRQIARNLRPYQLDQMGLTKAIRSLASQVEQSSGLILKLDLDDVDEVFPSAAEINVYRVVQEALNNVLRHAQATEALIRIERLGLELRILVADNGRGFSKLPSEGNDSTSTGFGLTNMRRRVEILGGALDIQTSAEPGAKLVVRLPIASARHES